MKTLTHTDYDNLPVEQKRYWKEIKFNKIEIELNDDSDKKYKAYIPVTIPLEGVEKIIRNTIYQSINYTGMPINILNEALSALSSLSDNK